MINLRDNYWAYPLPVSAEGAEIRGEHPGRPYQLLSFYGEADAVDLPPGNWKIVCTSKEVTEEQAKQIVEQQMGGGMFKDYQMRGSIAQYGTYMIQSALYSLRSLLTSKGCDLKLNYLILKKL